MLDNVVQEYVAREEALAMQVVSLQKALEAETQDGMVSRLPDPVCYDIYDELERDLRAELAQTKEALAKATDLLEERGST